MSLFNRNFIDFDGQPVTGRAPARVIVEGGVQLTPEQDAGVAHAYKLFCDVVRVSPATYDVQHRTLADGTKVRLVSNYGQDKVFVEPPILRPPVALEDILIGVMPDVFSSYSSTAKFSSQSRAGNTAPASLRTARLLEDGAGIRQHPGGLDWFNPDIKLRGKPILVSWYGPLARYGTAEYIGRGAQGDAMPTDGTIMSRVRGGAAWADQTEYFNSAKAAVWLNGIRFTVHDVSSTPVRVLSAALRRVSGVLTLYITAKGATKLAVYSGPIHKIDVKGGIITVTKLFDIDYTPDTTGWKYLSGASPIADQFPQWVGPVQPLYFNKSCTQIAGLVTFKQVDAPRSSFVTILKLITVDVDAHTTTFDASHALKQTTQVQGAITGFTAADVAANGGGTTQPGLYQQSLARTNGNFTIDSTLTNTVLERRYGGVDWNGDTLLIAMVEQTTIVQESLHQHATQDANGAGYPFTLTPDPTHGGPAAYPRSVSNTVTVTASTTGGQSLQSSWRVYLHGGATLAHRNNTLALTDSVIYAVNAQVTRTAHLDFIGDALRTDYSGVGGSNAGSSWNESATGDFFWFVTLEGGDLRRNCVNVLEIVERGTGTYTSTISPFLHSDLATEWLTFFNGNWDPFFGWLYSHDAFGALTLTDTADVKTRYMVTRGSAWIANTEVLTAENPTARAIYNNQRTQFGWRRIFGAFFPGGWAGFIPMPLNSFGWTGAGSVDAADGPGYTSTESRAQCEIGPSRALDITLSGSTTPVQSPERNRYIAGFVALSACAFNRAGTLGYVAMGAAGSTPGSQHAQGAEWIVAGTPQPAFSYTSGAWTYGGTVSGGVLTLSTPPKFLLVAPLFIDNVPRQS